MTAMVLAASRQGGDDPVASLQSKSHKCFVVIDGIAMIERVVQALLDSECFGRILISIEGEHLLRELASTRRWLEEGTVEVAISAVNLADSLAALATSRDESLFPLVITTADNVLHTPELIREFVTSFARGSGDVAVAATRESTVLVEYPDAGIGFFRFRDGGYSFCNLYGIRSVKGLDAAEVFRTGGQFRKHPWRILKAFGVVPLILYKWRLDSFDSLIQRFARNLGITIDAVILPYAFGPIDVDSLKSYEISERTLQQRRAQPE